MNMSDIAGVTQSVQERTRRRLILMVADVPADA